MSLQVLAYDLQRLGPIEKPRQVADGLGDQRFACGAQDPFGHSIAHA